MYSCISSIYSASSNLKLGSSEYILTISVSLSICFPVTIRAGVDAGYVRSFAFKVLKSKEIKYVRRRINAVLTFD